MSLAKDLKAKIDELELERRLKALVDDTEKTAGEAVEKAGGLAHERRDEIARALEKATTKINSQTKNQYVDKVEKVRHSLLEGLDKLAARRRLGDPVAPIEPPTGQTQDETQAKIQDGTQGGTQADRPTDPPLS
ncbi:Rv0909 family putative TA system antitoxin [Nocardioides houyundeii]|uniref:Rv0909 family putative TA system antitoxin n=1 Tax=Nocardioides houyundeii TaxID=2045452 RepID=UPI000C77B615|nr:Rv0909 family putative TA system antitoxin [Nocardioides houyundeii]